jgi:hypothetical protein
MVGSGRHKAKFSKSEGHGFAVGPKKGTTGAGPIIATAWIG